MNKDTLIELLEDACDYADSMNKQIISNILNSSSPLQSVKNFGKETTNWLSAASTKLIERDLTKTLSADLWVIPDLRWGIKVFEENNAYNIIINQGTFILLCFRVSSFIVARHALQLLENEPVSDLDKNDISLGYIDFLKMSNALTMYSLIEPNILPDFRKYMDTTDYRFLEYYLACAEIFIVLHENAHVVLNHFSEKPTNEILDSYSNLIYENTNELIKKEMQADITAIDSIPKQCRARIVSGASLFFELVITHEIYIRRISDNHPLSINRLNNLLEREDVKHSNERVIYNKGFLENFTSTILSQPEFIKQSTRNEMLNFYFLGKSPQYAVDFIEWYWSYINSLIKKYRV